MFRVESGDGEPQATIDRVGYKFVTFLLDIQNNCLFRGCFFHLLFGLFTTLYNFVDQLWQKSPLLLSTIYSFRGPDFNLLLLLFYILISHRILLFYFLLPLSGFVVVAEWYKGAFDFAETYVIFSDDRGIQWVEVEQQNVVLVEPFQWIDDVSSLILLLVCLLVIFVFIFSELVRNDQVSLDALMHNKELVAFCPLYVQWSPPDVTTNVAELSSNLQDLKVIHQSEGYFSLLSHLTDDLECFVVIQVS